MKNPCQHGAKVYKESIESWESLIKKPLLDQLNQRKTLLNAVFMRI